MAITLVLADDHPIVLSGLETLFHPEKDFKVVAQCRNGEEVLGAVRKHKPDVLILDIRIPVKDGLEVLRQIHKEALPIRVVFFTASLSEEEALEAIRLGIAGVVLKEMAPKFLIQCVRKVYAGEQWFERSSFGHALETVVRRETGTREIGSSLTPREVEIVRLLAGGLRNREIGKRLFISEGTVKIHLHHIFEKLKLNSRVALTLYARNKGLI